MPVYFFHIRDEHGLIEDLDGLELPHARAAALEAQRSVDEFCREAEAHSRMVIEVRDAAGRAVVERVVSVDDR